MQFEIENIRKKWSDKENAHLELKIKQDRSKPE